MKLRALFICGSMNQTRQMHAVASQLPEVDAWFTPYYGDGVVDLARRAGLLEFTILGSAHAHRAETYLRSHGLVLDHQGKKQTYDLVVTCSDLVIPRNITTTKIVLVQEGLTDPENVIYHIVRRFRFLPRWLASTSTTGLSHVYRKFCVASDGYREHFIRKGVRPESIVVTGIPNFDRCSSLMQNTFPHHHYVLVCTSDARETFKYENRTRYIRRAMQIAGGRPLIFKLHPNERVARAEREIRQLAPEALVFATGNTDEMIANCDVLITQYSTTVFVGLALGKECYSTIDIDELRRLLPLQNGRAAENIADVCRSVLGEEGIGR
jgi:hypothetical protein